MGVSLHSVILLYANQRLRNIMSGPNLAETKKTGLYKPFHYIYRLYQ